MSTSEETPTASKQAASVTGKRPKTYNLTTNEQRRELLDAISKKGLSVLKVRI